MRVRINTIDILKFVIVTSLLLVSSTWAANPLPAIPTLASDSRIATAGFYHLTWQRDDLLASAYELQEFNNTAFTQPTTIYRGPDQGTLIRGKQNDQYFIGSEPEVRANPSVLGVPQFPTAGATVFLTMLAFIIFGAWQSQKDKPK